jgi:hypothetical protein
MQSAVDHAEEVAANQKGRLEKAAHKAEAYVHEHAGEAKDRLAERSPRRRGKAS